MMGAASLFRTTWSEGRKRPRFPPVQTCPDTSAASEIAKTLSALFVTRVTPGLLSHDISKNLMKDTSIRLKNIVQKTQFLF